MFWLWTATADVRGNSPEWIETAANIYEVARTTELMRHVSRRQRLYSYHTAARSRTATAVPTVGRSAADSATQFKQTQKPHRRTTRLAVGIDDKPAYSRFVQWQFLMQIQSTGSSMAPPPIKQCSICPPTSGSRLTTDAGRSKQLPSLTFWNPIRTDGGRDL